MKKLSLLVFILIINISFAQTDNTLQVNLFEKETDENRFLAKPTIESWKIVKFKEIVPVNFKIRTNNNENKFSLNDNNPSNFLLLENTKPTKENTLKDKSMVVSVKQEFIKKLIASKILEESFLNQSFTYGDRSLEIYRNYPELVDILNVAYNINADVEIQIGDNIYPFINKSFKTEIDKTLNNSLNLLAINF